MGFSPDTLFQVQLDRRNGVARLALRGELDLATAPIFEDRFALASQDVAAALLVDLRGLAFMGSTGLRAMLRARTFAEGMGLSLAIVGATTAIRKVFQVTGTEELLDGPGGISLLAAFSQAGESDAGALDTEIQGADAI